MFDPEQFGAAMGDAIREAVAPLLKRVADLEAQVAQKGYDVEAVAAAVAALPAPKDGKDAELPDVAKMVAEAVAALPVVQPLKGDAGKSLTVEDVAPLIREQVEKAVAALPVPKDGLGLAGAMIDRDGALQITMTNGEVKNLGPVVGKDAVDGKDGISLESFDLEYIAESHEIVVKASAAGRTKELRYPAGGIRPAGYWREGTRAKAGEAWVNDGSLWIAVKDCQSQPGLNDAGWIIAARKGRDGENGRPPKVQDTSPIKLGVNNG